MNECQKCGKKATLIVLKTEQGDKSFELCEDCLGHLLTLIDLYLDIKRDNKLNKLNG